MIIRLHLLIIYIMAGIFQASAQVDLNRGLIAHYPFEGDANDISGNGLHGRLSKGLSFGADRLGHPYSAAHFDGITDFIEITHKGTLSNRSSFSFSFEFKTEDISRVQTLLARRNRAFQTEAQFQVFINWYSQPGVGYGHHFTNNAACNTVIHQYNAYTNTGPETIEKEKWYCVVGTFDGTYQRIYLDGVLMDSVRTPLSQIDSCTIVPVLVGKHTNSDPQSFRGALDELRFYNRALTKEEITALCDLTGNYYTHKHSASPFLKKAFRKAIEFTSDLTGDQNLLMTYTFFRNPSTIFINATVAFMLMRIPVMNFR